MNLAKQFMRNKCVNWEVVALKAVMLICVACGNGSVVSKIEPSKQGGVDYAQ